MAMGTSTRTGTTEPALDGAGLYRLMAWLSPAYPVGAFSYSHGLEYAVEAGLVRDEDGVVEYVDTVLRRGAGAIDGVLFAAAWRAAAAGDLDGLAAVAELGAAWRGTGETALESEAQGRAFLIASRAAWPAPSLEAAAAVLPEPPPYAITVGAVAAAHELPLAPALVAFYGAVSANLVSAGVRLVPLGQTAGQRAIARLERPCREAAEAACFADLATAGTAAAVIDWCSFRHETQYTRLFRS